MRRRTLLTAAALLPFGARVVSAAPPAEAITPALIEAAKKEGKVTYYTAMDLSVAEPMAKAFEAKYPGIKVAVERTGAERLFNRIAQEMASNIYRVDVVNSSDAAHFIVWKREGWLAPFVSDDMARERAGRHASIPTALSATSARISAPSPTTPGWCRRPMRPRASSTCSIRNTPASWSRAIPATPARS